MSYDLDSLLGQFSKLHKVFLHSENMQPSIASSINQEHAIYKTKIQN